MINYIKRNIDSISKLFINHIGMVVFSLVVFIASKRINQGLFYAMGVLAILMYFSLLYTCMWERGAKDKIKIDGGREKKNIFNGIFMYLIANFLVIITSIVAIIFSLLITEGPSFANSTYTVFTLISHYYSAIYLSITEINGLSNMPTAYSLVHLATVIPGMLISFLSYILGVKGFRCIFPEPKYDKNRKTR